MARLIEIIGLTKTYELGEVQVHALRGVDLAIERGEFVAVMGASGSGKSTLMNLLGCLDRPTSGKYVLEGVDVASLSEEELADIRSRKIGFVFQNFNLLSRTSALENVELPLFYTGWRADAGQRASDLLGMVGLGGRERSHPNQLSGGQQQRVAIARALINEPDILLADEPTGNLDSQNSAELMELIRRLNRERGLTVIVVTHDPDVAAYTDRVVTFRDGVIVSDERKPAEMTTPGARDPDDQLTAGASGMLTFASMALTTAARALRRNKMRSVLTILGIFIGVAAVIAMVAVGEGARSSVEAQLASLGTNLLVVLPGATTANGVRAGFGSASTLTVADAESLQKEVGAGAYVSYLDRQVAQVVYGNRNWSTVVNGTTPDYLIVRDWPVVQGRPFSDEETRGAAPVCLIGQTVLNNLFAPGENPIGETIRVKNFPLKVVGVLAAKGQSTWGQDQDDIILMPFPTAERKVLGVAPPSAANTNSTSILFNPTSVRPNPFGASAKIAGVVNNIFLKAQSSEMVDLAMRQMIDALHRRHHIQPNQDDDFTVRSLDEMAQVSENASSVLTTLLATVASISLLVGGIGIMNIMLVSVTERTREIGIRMAIGARRVHIMLQFLVEAVFLSALGGLAGAILGIVASKLISALAGWPTLLSPAAIIGGFAFSAAVGVFFGYYPARKASLLDPIEALRYE